MSEGTFDFGTVRVEFGNRGLLELQNCPKMETFPNRCIICDKFIGFVGGSENTVGFKELFKSGIKCSMVSDIKCGNSLCYNYNRDYSGKCSRFGKVIECKVFQQINKDPGGINVK